MCSTTVVINTSSSEVSLWLQKNGRRWLGWQSSLLEAAEVLLWHTPTKWWWWQSSSRQSPWSTCVDFVSIQTVTHQCIHHSKLEEAAILLYLWCIANQIRSPLYGTCQKKLVLNCELVVILRNYFVKTKSQTHRNCIITKFVNSVITYAHTYSHRSCAHFMNFANVSTWIARTLREHTLLVSLREMFARVSLPFFLTSTGKFACLFGSLKQLSS